MATKQLLHSDVLRQLYSTITLSVESQTVTIRKIHLLGSEGVTRTYAITHFYPSNWDQDITLVAAEIKRGKSIGKTLQNHGYNIEKVLICATRVTLTNRLKDSMKHRVTTTLMCSSAVSPVKPKMLDMTTQQD